jgi:hypothetical protein
MTTKKQAYKKELLDQYYTDHLECEKQQKFKAAVKNDAIAAVLVYLIFSVGCSLAIGEFMLDNVGRGVFLMAYLMAILWIFGKVREHVNYHCPLWKWYGVA